jgi:hypothetical protein
LPFRDVEREVFGERGRGVVEVGCPVEDLGEDLTPRYRAAPLPVARGAVRLEPAW